MPVSELKHWKDSRKQNKDPHPHGPYILEWKINKIHIMYILLHGDNFSRKIKEERYQEAVLPVRVCNLKFFSFENASLFMLTGSKVPKEGKE